MSKACRRLRYSDIMVWKAIGLTKHYKMKLKMYLTYFATA